MAGRRLKWNIFSPKLINIGSMNLWRCAQTCGSPEHRWVQSTLRIVALWGVSITKKNKKPTFIKIMFCWLVFVGVLLYLRKWAWHTNFQNPDFFARVFAGALLPPKVHFLHEFYHCEWKTGTETVLSTSSWIPGWTHGFCLRCPETSYPDLVHCNVVQRHAQRKKLIFFRSLFKFNRPDTALQLCIFLGIASCDRKNKKLFFF